MGSGTEKGVEMGNGMENIDCAQKSVLRSTLLDVIIATGSDFVGCIREQ